VSADKIALPAMRCATLLTHVAEQVGVDAVSRDGSRLCCEVYPDPALRRWTDHAPEGLARRESYKGRAAAEKRIALLSALRAQLPLDDTDRLLEKVGLQDDYLDALICALVARAVELEQTYGPETKAELERAQVEGWIHLPSAALENLGAARISG